MMDSPSWVEPNRDNELGEQQILQNLSKFVLDGDLVLWVSDFDIHTDRTTRLFLPRTALERLRLLSDERINQSQKIKREE